MPTVGEVKERGDYQEKPEGLKWGLSSSGRLEADGVGWHGSRKNLKRKAEELKCDFRPRGGYYFGG